MTTLSGSVSPGWLRLREPADALARSGRLVEPLWDALSDGRGLQIHDIGCGSGSMGRWLAPLLPTSQRWVLHDRDPGLLEIAVAQPPRDREGHRVVVEAAPGDLTELTATDLSGASLVTTSALLDILTDDELTMLVDLCSAVDCPALFTLSVTGAVRLCPEDPRDAELGAAFNDHQRRTAHGRSLLGPDAPRRTAELFLSRGAEVEIADSTWRLGAESRDLAEEWLRGWVSAACEQRPQLGRSAGAYLDRRREQLAAGLLDVSVAHVDILARPRRAG